MNDPNIDIVLQQLSKMQKNSMLQIFSSKLIFSFQSILTINFDRIIKYLNGTYHLEEIASLENMTRLQISTIIEKFQTIVIRALHPDPNPILQI
jgi:hypothetical protein